MCLLIMPIWRRGRSRCGGVGAEAKPGPNVACRRGSLSGGWSFAFLCPRESTRLMVFLRVWLGNKQSMLSGRFRGIEWFVVFVIFVLFLVQYGGALSSPGWWTDLFFRLILVVHVLWLVIFSTVFYYIPKGCHWGRFSGGRPLRQGVPYAASLFVFGNCLSMTEGLGGDVRHHRFSRGILFECLNLGRLPVAFGIFSRMAKQCLKGQNMCGNGKHCPRGREQVFAQSFECIIFDKFH